MLWEFIGTILGGHLRYSKSLLSIANADISTANTFLSSSDNESMVVIIRWKFDKNNSASQKVDLLYLLLFWKSVFLYLLLFRTVSQVKRLYVHSFVLISIRITLEPWQRFSEISLHFLFSSSQLFLNYTFWHFLPLTLLNHPSKWRGSQPEVRVPQGDREKSQWVSQIFIT